MVKYKYWKVITILLKIILGISASTHWVVTENGKIQSQLDSTFHMRRPYDLLSLLEQEQRAAEIEHLYHEMVRRKTTIDEEWAGLESATELEARLYSSDPDCLQAGKPLSDVDLYTSVADDGVGRDGVDLEQLSPVDVHADSPDLPDCAAQLDLKFSMRTFPHLQVLSWNLTTGAEDFGSVKSLMERSGRHIASGLSRNHTSWFLHNLAALYWRSRGDARHALHCAKRAVYLAPRQYRDVALLNLGCVVQQAHCPAEAAILLHAAVDHAPHRPHSHFALANVYAILGDYNRSVACYDNALKLQPGWPAAGRNRFAVICHHKLENSLYQLHRSLQGILGQLHDYHSLQEQWLKHQEQLMYEQAPLEVKLQGFQHEPLAALLSHRGEKCVPQIKDGSTVLSCDSKLLAHHLQIDITLSLQLLLKNVESQAQKISEQMSRRLMSPSGSVTPELDESKTEPSEEDGEGHLEIFVETAEEEPELKRKSKEDNVPRASSHFLPYKHPKLQSLRDVGIKVKDSVMGFFEDFVKSQTNEHQFFMPEKQCKSSSFNTDGCSEDMSHWLLPKAIDNEESQYNILPIAQSLGIVEEGSWLHNTSTHVIATLIITCIQLSQWDSSEIPSTKDQPQCFSVPGSLAELSPDSFRHMSPDPRLKTVFHSLLLDDDISVVDVTSHLSHALKDKSRHDEWSAWLLDTAAALYWRWVGNSNQMVSCLQAAVHKAPLHLKDIPLHHVAYILFALGHHQEALVLESLAAKVSPHSVLSRAYQALGEPKDVQQYRKTLQTLNQQVQTASSPP